MPELPEVENVVWGLKNKLKNYIITSVDIRVNSLVAFPEVENFKKEIKNKKILDITRRGKYILFHLSSKKTMVIHLRMTGKLLIKDPETSLDKHTHVIFHLNTEKELRFNNIRKFGRMYLVNNNEYENAGGLSELGPEPLAADFTFEKFKKKFENRTANIKSLLLNQKFIAGLGNIYTDEILYRSAIDPKRKANSLKEKELKKIYNNMREILKLGIKYNGTTFSDYVNAFGEKGKFQEKLQVYQKDGEKCNRCSEKINKTKVAGRSTYYCPGCQK
ncbi:MAG: bifunctional DNA-formamidopyrimidine glycosylase/DNA-(apurinic or apyrimidinic site) lyase [Bacillota bacterium]